MILRHIDEVLDRQDVTLFERHNYVARIRCLVFVARKAASALERRDRQLYGASDDIQQRSDINLHFTSLKLTRRPVHAWRASINAIIFSPKVTPK